MNDNGKVFWVAAYKTTREYGVTEQGGLWHDQGELVTERWVYEDCGMWPATFSTNEAALAYCAKMGDALDATVNVGLRPLSSVLSTGRYEPEIHEGTLPIHSPEMAPEYA